MGASVLKASIKKIEIVNITRKDEWDQSVRVILGDIELNNENFIALRRFRPDEIVHVSIESAQMSLFDQSPKQRLEEEFVGNDTAVNEVEEVFEGSLFVDDEMGENDVVVKEFRL